MKKISKNLIFSLLFMTTQVDASSKPGQEKTITPASCQALEHILVQHARCNTTQTGPSSSAETSTVAQSSSSTVEQLASVNELMIEAFSAKEIQDEIAVLITTSPNRISSQSSSSSSQSNKKRKTEDKKSLENRLLSVQSIAQNLFIHNDQLNKLVDNQKAQFIKLQAQEASNFEANNEKTDEIKRLKSELADKNAELIAATAREIAHASELRELQDSVLRTEIALDEAQNASQIFLAQRNAAAKLPETIKELKQTIFDVDNKRIKAEAKIADIYKKLRSETLTVVELNNSEPADNSDIEIIELNGSEKEYNSGSED